jgi:hypothetical protein
MLQHMLGGTSLTSLNSTEAQNSAAEFAEAQRAQFEEIFTKLAHALSVLSSAPDLMMSKSAANPHPSTMHVWLRPNARQAEEAMHQLRDMRLAPSHTLTELSQCLTILVLAADMLSEGQLSDVDANECYELLRRNADRAVSGLYELHNQLNLSE